jgi:serine/threonine-protein kinase HipA
MNGKRVGTWELKRQENVFIYDSEWLQSPQARPLSLSMPLRSSTTPYKGRVVEAFFDNLLPDSKLLRERFQASTGASSAKPMDLLERLGRDCLGAVRLLPKGENDKSGTRWHGKELSERDIASILGSLGAPSSFGTAIAEQVPQRISLAGNHDKTALLRVGEKWYCPHGPTPTTHIIKPPIGNIGQLDLSLSVENEWLTMELVRAFGLPAAGVTTGTFEDQKCLIVERFDRSFTEDGKSLMRLPHEDLCQALSVMPGLKYESDGGPGIKTCLKLLANSAAPREDREVFFRAKVLFWLLAAIDGHAKNFSLQILRKGRFRLAPLYDVLSAYPLFGKGQGKMAPQEAKMAMAAWGKNKHYRWQKIVRRHWVQVARDCGIANPDEHLDFLKNRAPDAVKAVGVRLPDRFPKSVADAIFEGLLGCASRL